MNCFIISSVLTWAWPQAQDQSGLQSGLDQAVCCVFLSPVWPMADSQQQHDMYAEKKKYSKNLDQIDVAAIALA